MTALSIVLLAMIAAFLGLRLYSVLGKRTGHEQEPVLPRADDRTTVNPARIGDTNGVTAPRDGALPATGLVYEPEAEAGVRALLSVDRSFDAGRFMEGAEAAYRMILEAFWTGDRDTLRDLTDDDSYQAFVAAIEAREKTGETLDNRLVRIESSRIARVELTGNLARVTVRYRADIVAITRDSEGQMIAGSLSDASEINDLWTFSRTIGSNDPNWLLDETEAS